MKFKTKDIIKLAIPIILEFLLTIMANLFDGIMVSSEGEAAVSGVSLTGSVNAFLVVFFLSLCSGGAIVIAQLIGKKDIDTANETAKQLLYISLAISVFICIIVMTLHGPILQLVFGKVDAEVMENAKIYFFITGISYPFIGIQSASSSILRAQGRTKLTLAISVGGNLVNIVGNAILIFVCGMGVKGAAIATLISYIVAAAIALIFTLRKKHNVVYIQKLFRYKPNAWYIKKICHIGVPNGLEDSFFQFGRLIVASLISGFGTASIAANAVAQTLTNFHFQTGSAINTAAITVIGMCIGAGDYDEAKKNVKKFIIFVFTCYVFLSIFFILTAGIFAKIYNLSPEATEICRNVIIINGIATVLIWPFAFTLASAFRAASDVRFTMIVSILSMFTFRVAGSYFLAYVFDLGVYSVWIAMIADWLFRTLMFLPRFIKGKWLMQYKG